MADKVVLKVYRIGGPGCPGWKNTGEIISQLILKILASIRVFFYSNFSILGLFPHGQAGFNCSAEQAVITADLKFCSADVKVFQVIYDIYTQSMPLAANSEDNKSKRLRLAIVCLFLLSVVVLPLPVLSANIHLESDSAVATAGYFRLSWLLQTAANKDAVEYQLQRSEQPDFAHFKVVYLGPDLARVVSGKPNGDYYYRVRVLQDGVPVSDWSDTTRVTVVHHSITRALLFFLAGAVVFFSLLTYLLMKHNRD